MLKRLHVREFTVFADATFEFGPGLNVLVGTNGTGKSHVLKLGYAVGVASIRLFDAQQHSSHPGFATQARLMDALTGIYRVEGLWNLRRRSSSVEPFVKAFYTQPSTSLAFDLTPSSKDSTGVAISENPIVSLPAIPLFIPAKEVLSFYEGFATLYRKYNLAFDQTYLDLCEALSGPTLREPGLGVQETIAVLERIMQGRVALEGGRFYLYPQYGERQEINMAAEGIRKFATLAQLLANGSLTPDTTLFWDEPEANLNPALLQELAQLLVTLAGQGFQIILATHSLFLLKAFHILSRQHAQRVCYFGLSAAPGEATQVATTDDLTLLPDIAALDAELAQSDEFVTVLNTAGDEA